MGVGTVRNVREEMSFFLPSPSSCSGVSDSPGNYIPLGWSTQQVGGVQGGATYLGYKTWDTLPNMPHIFISTSEGPIRSFPQVKGLENPHFPITFYFYSFIKNNKMPLLQINLHPHYFLLENSRAYYSYDFGPLLSIQLYE